MYTDADLELADLLHNKWDKEDRKAFVNRMINKANSRESHWR